MHTAGPRITQVDIRPGVSVLSVLRHLNYRPWFALAEFVDNALQSFLANRDRLKALHGEQYRLRVKIDIDASTPSRITIRDNASGIAAAEYPRAFRPAAIPPDRSGLAEFGMGMKSAACWFAPQWTVRTAALDEGVERTVQFDIARIVYDQIEELSIEERSIDREAHFTEVILQHLNHVPIGRTVAKIKDHLTDIYRVFVRNGDLVLLLNNEPLVYVDPLVLRAPYFKTPNGESLEWRKDIVFDFGSDLSVAGFAGLREPANVSRSGFALFRRGRLIQGSGDEGYRPEFIFGKSNSYRYQRLFGELHLSGFDVSHTKDGFRWDENEQPFLELLRDYLDSNELPLLKQAEGYRARAARNEVAAAAQQAVDRTAEVLEAHLPRILPAMAAADPVETQACKLEPQPTLAARELSFTFKGREWRIRIELTNDPAQGDWLSISNVEGHANNPRIIELRLSLAHPFMVRFAQTDPEDVEALLRVGAAIGVSEILARDAGVKQAGTVRRNVNDILRDALSGA